MTRPIFFLSTFFRLNGDGVHYITLHYINSVVKMREMENERWQRSSRSSTDTTGLRATLFTSSSAATVRPAPLDFISLSVAGP
mmetsp:Transcript_2413/g.5057  ORF Transcript_2413/g.5057 Transcript_2413/m.5057 type:complete len:83 (+) Transcript_2413:1209-1457(+)